MARSLTAAGGLRQTPANHHQLSWQQKKKLTLMMISFFYGQYFCPIHSFSEIDLIRTGPSPLQLVFFSLSLSLFPSRKTQYRSPCYLGIRRKTLTTHCSQLFQRVIRSLRRTKRSFFHSCSFSGRERERERVSFMHIR